MMKILEKIKELHKLQEVFSTDQMLHFAFSYIICSVITIIFNANPLLAIVITYLIGLAKECMIDDTLSISDLNADLIGACTFALVLSISYIL